jgi:hypothetical protein
MFSVSVSLADAGRADPFDPHPVDPRPAPFSIRMGLC